MNLFPDIFPEDMIPISLFEKEISPIDIPEDIWITDTTFRDGQQARAPFTQDEILDLFDLIHELDNNTGLIRQSEFFLYSDRDREAILKCKEKGYTYPEVVGWMRAREEDLSLVDSLDLKEVGILTSISDYHIYLKLKKNRKEAIGEYLKLIDKVLEKGIIPRCHLEDVTRADFYEVVVPFVQELMKRQEETGVPIKVRLCDTLGYGLPFPNVTLPRSVPKLISNLKKETGISSSQLEWHGHNDFHYGLVNGVAAWLYGASAVNGTLLGIGERTGNTPIEALVIHYISLKGSFGELNLKKIKEIGEYFEKYLSYPIPYNYPFLGRDAFTTRAGIHADGLLKDSRIYNIFDTESIIGRSPRILINNRSGKAGIVYWINKRLGNTNGNSISKNDERVTYIYEKIMKEYERGRITAISDEEMEEFFNEYF